VLAEMQDGLFAKALAYRRQHTHAIDAYDDFKAWFSPRNAEKPEIHGGFALAHWCNNPSCEERIAAELGVTIRLIPFDREASGPGKCVYCGSPSSGRVVFAKAY